MEENLLKYFTGQGNPTTETTKPLNIINKAIEDQINLAHARTLTTNDNTYFIRYGGDTSNSSQYNSITVYNANALDNGEPLYTFNNIQVLQHNFYFTDLKQDENGRFYGVGVYYNTSTSQYENYLILLNNFIQDGQIIVRQVYTNTRMGIATTTPKFDKVVKISSSAIYLIYNAYNRLIYYYKIDIQTGNELRIYTLQEGGSITSGTLLLEEITAIGNNIYFVEIMADDQKAVCKKVVIDIEEEVESYYTIGDVSIIYLGTNTYISSNFYGYNYYVAYKTSSNDLLFYKVNLDGTSKSYSIESTISPIRTKCSIINNYVFEWNNYSPESAELNIYYFDLNDTNIFYKFLSNNFYGSFDYPVVLKKFNLLYFCGLNSLTGISFSKNIYSEDYTSEPYYNNNFMIPQYLNLYTKANDLTSLVYSRDVINRFYAGNQLTATFNIPNYLLNNQTIHREIVNGQTNLSVEDNNKSYSKNRFESLYMTYIYNMYIKDNTNGDNLINYGGSNRIANSVWKELDYQASPCLKARITYNDINNTQTIITLNTPTISGTTATYTYQVSGDIVKIEYLSNDENTVYATYRCNLTGTNTITQTIEVEEG